MNIECSCIKGVFDFTICHNDCSKIVYSDLSDWMEEDYYTLPETYPATITHPLGNTSIINFKPKSSTVITAAQFGAGASISDGVYCISVTSCGTTYTKSFALLPNMRKRIDSLYLDEKVDKETLDTLERYQKYIQVNAMFDKKEVAKDYFEMSSKILDRIDCKNC